MLEGTIPLGTWPRQETIATEFGVSRTPVREALRKLQTAGVVERFLASAGREDG